MPGYLVAYCYNVRSMSMCVWNTAVRSDPHFQSIKIHGATVLLFLMYMHVAYRCVEINVDGDRLCINLRGAYPLFFSVGINNQVE